MKIKYILSFFIVVLMFAACNEPLQDIYDEIDNAKKDFIVANVELTLTETDYNSMGENYGEPGFYDSFSNSVLPQDFLPDFLANKYPALGEASRALITYDFYPGRSAYLDSIPNAIEYELANPDDYDSMGEDYGQPGYYNNFSSSVPPEGYLPDFLATKFPNAIEGTMYKVIYRYYDGSVSTRSDYYYLTDGNWAPLPNSYTLTSNDYDSMGAPGKYNNFSDSDKPDDYLPTFLGIKFPYAKADDVILVVYDYYVGGGVTETRGSEYKYDGSSWKNLASTYAVTEEYLHNGTVWIPAPKLVFIKSDKANTREYTLTDADYELVGNGKYHNFDVRPGKAEEDEAVRIDKISTILKANFVDIAEGDVWLVHYNVYTGSAEVWDITLEVVLE